MCFTWSSIVMILIQQTFKKKKKSEQTPNSNLNSNWLQETPFFFLIFLTNLDFMLKIQQENK